MSDNFDVPKALSGTGGWLDDRFHGARGFRVLMRKVFPDHWSFLLGEIALWSFVILLLTGTFLSLFFVPSMSEVVYHGSYVKLDGIRMSEAYQSTLNISFDVRGGLLMRQIHHWAADLFMASLIIHMLRIFFTGAFRKPRELNWVIGFLLFVLAMAEGFTGYSLPDDLLSGNGLRIIDGLVTCPWHGFQYRLEDGCAPPPFTERLATHRVRINRGVVEVDPQPLPPGTPAGARWGGGTG